MLGLPTDEMKAASIQATQTLKEVELTAIQIRTVTVPKVQMVLDNLYTITSVLRMLVERK